MRSFFCQLIVLVAVCSAHAQSAPSPPDRSVVAELQKGGYVLYLRHFRTDPGQTDTVPVDFDDVSAQRRLTDEGRQQARDVGQAFRSLEIPIARIVCSRFDRVRESAELLGLGTPVPTPDVTSGGPGASRQESERRAEALRQLLSTPPASGQNHLIVSHSPNLQQAAGKEFADIDEGEIVVFQPAGDGKYRLVARVSPPSLWTEWSK